MPFDAEFLPARLSPAQSLAERLMGPLADPDPALAAADPARLLAFLFVAPRPCVALDALIDRA
ncbi:MAG: hypothetical protein ACR2FH_06240 [Caulobacteraceae bacterium]